MGWWRWKSLPFYQVWHSEFVNPLESPWSIGEWWVWLSGESSASCLLFMKGTGLENNSLKARAWGIGVVSWWVATWVDAIIQSLIIDQHELPRECISHHSHMGRVLQMGNNSLKTAYGPAQQEPEPRPVRKACPIWSLGHRPLWATSLAQARPGCWLLA